jgi:hypothetical protein
VKSENPRDSDINMNSLYLATEKSLQKPISNSSPNSFSERDTLIQAMSSKLEVKSLNTSPEGITIFPHLGVGTSATTKLSIDTSKSTPLTPTLTDITDVSSPVCMIDSPIIPSPLPVDSPRFDVSPRVSMAMKVINNVAICVYEDYMAEPEWEIAPKKAYLKQETSKTQLRKKIIHTQHDSLQNVKIQGVEDTKRSRSFHIQSTNFTSVKDLRVSNQQGVLQAVTQLFVNESVLNKLKLDPTFYDTLKILFKCMYLPRVLYKTMPEDERAFLLKNSKICIHEPTLFVKILKCFNFQGEDGLVFIRLIESADSAKLTMEQALELLCDKRSNVRQIGIKILEHQDLQQIELFLFFIVQTIRFENWQELKEKKSRMLRFLIHIASKSTHILTKLYWYVFAETKGDKKMAPLFSVVLQHLQSKFKDTPAWDLILRQDQLVTSLTAISKYLAGLTKDRLVKQELLNQILENHEILNLPNWKDVFGKSFFLPLDSHTPVSSFIKGSGRIFKSALAPILIATDAYSVIFKRGDDLRQDNLVLLLIKFMSDCFLSKNMDLHLTPYHIISTGIDTGFVECVSESITIGGLLREYPNGIKEFFMKNSSQNGVVDPNVIGRYIKSCAGYSVITYILGIGDRHLDNILISKNGKFFHIDFGYILGYDPKPFPPKMRLSKEMIDGMGGYQSTEFVQFKILCCEAFKILRKFSNYILVLFNTMVNANLKQINYESLQNVVFANLKLDMNDDTANDYMIKLIDESLTLLMPQITEKFHELAQSLKK